MKQGRKKSVPDPLPAEARDAGRPAPVEPRPAPRVVAIVGRPNVGKSALFNRLVGQRLAIVHEESGVTRDRLIREAVWDEQRFELIDTGGLDVPDATRADQEIHAGTRRQVEVAIEDAAVILWVVDLTAGILPLDEEVGRLLRRSGKPVLLAANKADTAPRDAAAAEFTALGYPCYPVSALHNRGLEPLLDEVLRRLPPGGPAQPDSGLKVAVVGRPNVGKSSFINRLLGRERLIVSAVPGTTRDSIEIPFVIGQGPQARHYLLIDTAGLRRAGHVHEAVEKFSALRTDQSIERADVVVLMIEAEQGPTAYDKRIAAHIQEAKKGCVLMVNKWDLADGKVKPDDYEKALRRALAFLDYVPICLVSAHSGLNLRQGVAALDRVAASVATTLPTGLLNRVLQGATQRVQPPQVNGHRLKVYYGTQIGTRPVRIKLFVNDPHRLAPAYETYLIRCLRKAFGLEGAPVVLHLQSSHEESSAAGRRPR
ncbi:MAG: ribosome biogenesis GTPase Der [Kiritimatiellaeota bacterium]|nr:ribosome biogenesis GTPase Der [Kiritimatiellota bacterium]